MTNHKLNQVKQMDTTDMHPQLRQKREDYLKQHTPVVYGHRKIGRNELCACGSKKKFKHCCINK